MSVAARPSRKRGARVAAAVVKLRFVIVALWVAAAVSLTLALPSIGESQTGSLGDLVPADAEALDAELRSNELFGFPLLSRTLVVQRDADGLSASELAQVAARAAQLNRGELPMLQDIAGALVITNAIGNPPFTRERATTAIKYLFFEPDISSVDREEATERLVDEEIEPSFDGFTGATGAVAARIAQANVIHDDLPLVELATVVLVALAVALHFRALGAPLVNLAAVTVSYLVAIRLLAWIGQQIGVSVPSEVEPVIVVLLFGVITDYTIFFLSRFRRRLADGDERLDAATRTLADLLPTILTAGLTVAGASAALVVADLGFLKAFGPGMAISVLIAMAVVLTLVPALLAIGGLAVFWPRRPGRELPTEAAAEETAPDEGRPRRLRVGRIASEHPVVTALACSVVLVVMASGVTRLDVGNPLIRGLPQDSDARVAYEHAKQGFAPGILAPTVILVEDEGIAQNRAALARLQRLIERDRGVAEVAGPGSVPIRVALGGVVAESGDAARYVVILDSDPLGSRALNTLRRLERRLPRLVERAGLGDVRTSIAGDTAIVRETVDKTAQDLLRVAPVAILAVLVGLAVFLRALVAPLYLVATSILALGASLGVTVWFFQDVLGHGELTYYVPFAAAVLLMALGSDYNVFIVGRIWQEARRRPLREAVAVGGARAATPITVAGLVLAGSFALLALVDLRPFRELAFAMSVGLLIDAFVVRTLLVPALISLVGQRSAWPGSGLREAHAAPVGGQPPA